jgi:hypothetical protein
MRTMKYFLAPVMLLLFALAWIHLSICEVDSLYSMPQQSSLRCPQWFGDRISGFPTISPLKNERKAK